MVLNFPQRLEQPFINLDADITSKMCEEFEAIEQTGDYEQFFSKYLVFFQSRFPDKRYDELSIEDYYGVRDLLYLMFRLREMATRGTPVSDDELADAGIAINRYGMDDAVIHETSSGDALPRRIHALPALSFRIRGKVNARYYIEQMLDFEGADPDCLDWKRLDDLPKLIYRPLARHEYFGFDPMIDSHIEIDDGVVTCHLVSKYFYRDETLSNQDCAAIALESLVDLHLVNVITTNNVGVPYQLCEEGLTALWLAYCNKLTHTRVAICKACGKPILVTGERGTPRMYCDDTCRKWANRNPGKKRAMRVRQ